MKYYSYLFKILAVSALYFNTSCAQEQNSRSGYEKTESGIQYKIFRTNNDAATAKIGDLIDFDFVMMNYKDSIIQTTFDDVRKTLKNIPCQLPSGKGDPTELFVKFAEGDSVVAYISVDTLAKSAGRDLPPFFPKNTEIKYIFKIKGIKSKEVFEKEMAEKAAKQKDVDDKILQDYIKANNLKAEKTASGLYYVIKEEGTGEKPANGKMVTVHYKGLLLSGKVFDESYKRGEPFQFQLGMGQVIKGWDEGIALLKKGGKATLLIPSTLAYGSQGAGADIKPDEVLLFEVELIDFK